MCFHALFDVYSNFISVIEGELFSLHIVHVHNNKYILTWRIILAQYRSRFAKTV